MRSLIDILDLSNDELYALMKTARDIIENPLAYSDKCKGKKLATLFFEPSTRTRLSFEAAMLDLGGGVLSVEAASSSSAAKGESIADTAKVISCYADIMAMRHFKEGASLVAAQSADIPVINAGDGGHCHPTQTLADLLTIYTEKERLSGLTVGLCGDLKYGRTVHSLVNALARYENVRFVFISPEELKAPDYIKNGRNYVEETSLSDAIGSLDVLYMTRIQKERFDDKAQYERLKDSYILTAELMEKAKSDCIVMHPLPRVNEISVSVDSDKRACYFKQVKNGKAMRMALILKLLSDVNGKKPEYQKTEKTCRNLKCVVSSEPEIERLCVQKDGKLRCAYCDTEL